MVTSYIANYFAREDEELRQIRENSSRQGFPSIHVPAHVGKLLYLLTKLQRPEKVLEIGTLGGYSTLWMLRALSATARLITLEIDPKRAHLARENLAQYASQCEIRTGDALHLLQAMIDTQEGPFDLIFIDADKAEYSRYLKLALLLSKPGTLILTDNLIPKGEPIDNPDPRNKEATAVYQFNQELAAHPSLESILSTTLVGPTSRLDALGISLVRE